MEYSFHPQVDASNASAVNRHQASRISIGNKCGIKWLCDRGTAELNRSTILVTPLYIDQFSGKAWHKWTHAQSRVILMEFQITGSFPFFTSFASKSMSMSKSMSTVTNSCFELVKRDNMFSHPLGICFFTQLDELVF